MGRGGLMTMVDVPIEGDTIYAANWNAEFLNIINNLDPSGIGSYYQNAAEMQAESDPYAGGTPAVAASHLVHHQQISYVLSQLLGTQYWYVFPDLKSIDNADSPYTTTQNEEIILADATSGNITINLPAVSGLKDSKRYTIIKTDSSANTVTVDGNSGETINGILTRVLDIQYEVLSIVRDGTNWLVTSKSKDDYILIRDEKSSGTAGGTFTSGAWQTRDLNTEVTDTGGHASVASNQITLAAGTYRCNIMCPAVGVATHQAKLYNTTDTADIILGMNAESTGSAIGSYSIITGRFTITASKVLEVQHRCEATVAGSGFGFASGWGTEVYTTVELIREN